MGQHTIIFQKDPKVVLTNIRYTNVCTFAQDAHNVKLDIMWQVSMHVSQPRPLWSGYMQSLHYGISNQGKRTQLFLPIFGVEHKPTCRGERKALGHVTLMMACPIDEHRRSAVLLLMTVCRSKGKEGDRMARL